MLKWIVAAVILLLAGCNSAPASHPMLPVTPYTSIEAKIGKGGAMLLELGSTSCSGCRDMAYTLYLIKKKNPKSQIYFIDIKKERDVALKYNVRMMPTQVILDESGNVVNTHIGPISMPELTEMLKHYRII